MIFKTSKGYFGGKPIESASLGHSEDRITYHPYELVQLDVSTPTATHTSGGVPVILFGPNGQLPDLEGQVGWQSRTIAYRQGRRWVTSGVRWHKHSQQWQVRIQTNNVSVCGGYYKTLLLAENMANMLRAANCLHMLKKLQGDMPPDVGSEQWCRENFFMDELGVLYRIRINGNILRTRLSSKQPNVREVDALLHAHEIRDVLLGKLSKAKVYGNVDAYGLRIGAKLSEEGVDTGEDASVYGEMPERIMEASHA